MKRLTEPHLSPAKLVGQSFSRDTFGDARIALLGYCPPPRALEKYSPVPTQNQYFIHVSPHSVQRLSHNGLQFLSLAHVYGGPVSASTVEELAYYGFDYILAYGLAGALGSLPMGAFYQVETALVADGTTPHYVDERIVEADRALGATVEQFWPMNDWGPLHRVQAITADAIYREDDAFLDSARAAGCDIVNLDSSHLFAVAKTNCENKVMSAIECGVVSDVAKGPAHSEWDSNLSAMLLAHDGAAPNPLDLAGRIVEFYVETLAPVLLRGHPPKHPSSSGA